MSLSTQKVTRNSAKILIVDDEEAMPEVPDVETERDVPAVIPTVDTRSSQRRRTRGRRGRR